MANDENIKYVQLKLDLTKPYEKSLADYLDKRKDNEGIPNKTLLMMGLKELMDNDKENLINLIAKTNEKTEKISEELKEIKFMLRFLFSGNASIDFSSLAAAIDSHKQDEKIGIDTSSITKGAYKGI